MDLEQIAKVIYALGEAKTNAVLLCNLAKDQNSKEAYQEDFDYFNDLQVELLEEMGWL